MKIKMKVEALGADDGVDVKKFLAGEEYEVSDDLGKCFLSTNSAEEVLFEEVKEEVSEKALSKAPKNKAK